MAKKPMKAVIIVKAAGGRKKLASLLHITGPAISQWGICPVNRVLAVEKATGLSRHDIRPDIYGPEP